MSELLRNRMLTVNEAAEMLGVCAKTMRRYLKKKEITYIQYGSSRIRVPWKAVEHYLLASRNHAAPKKEKG